MYHGGTDSELFFAVEVLRVSVVENGLSLNETSSVPVINNLPPRDLAVTFAWYSSVR